MANADSALRSLIRSVIHEMTEASARATAGQVDHDHIFAEQRAQREAIARVAENVASNGRRAVEIGAQMAESIALVQSDIRAINQRLSDGDRKMDVAEQERHELQGMLQAHLAECHTRDALREAGFAERAEQRALLRDGLQMVRDHWGKAVSWLTAIAAVMGAWGVTSGRADEGAAERQTANAVVDKAEKVSSAFGSVAIEELGLRH